MKISEMNNEQAADVIIRLTVPFGNICDDEKIVNVIKDYKEAENVPVIQAIGKYLPQMVTLLLKTHKDDLFEIIGALDDKTPAQVAKMNFLETIKVVKNSYDEVLHNFFTSSINRTKVSGG